MKSNRARICTAVTMAGLAASLVLTGCGLQPGMGPAAASNLTVNGTTEHTPGLAVVSASTATPVLPAAAAVSTSAMPASSAKHATPARKTFTFPDGHISFSYPEEWTVRTVLPPAGLPGVEAIVADSAGNDLLFVGNGMIAGCTGGPVSRRVFDQEAVPGMAAPNGAEPAFGFVVESYGEGDAYYMGLSDPRSLVEGEGVSSWCNLVPTGNGGLSTRVLFNDSAFQNRGGARAWMATDEFAQLKALLTSLTYD